MIDKVVATQIPCEFGGPSYTAVLAYPHSALCIAESQQPGTDGPFLLCKSAQMQRDLGGYEATLRLLSRLLCVGKCNEASMVFCVMLQQLEPEITLVFAGHAVFDVRIEGGGYLHFLSEVATHSRSPVIEVKGPFTSMVASRMTGGPAGADVDVMDSWNCCHTWLTFKTHGDDGRPLQYIMDLSAPQFGIFGEKLCVDPTLPEVFVFIHRSDGRGKKTKTLASVEDYADPETASKVMPVAYCASSTATSIPHNFHALFYASWMYTHNNLFYTPNTKLVSICATFLERRYPRSIRQLPRPYNYPEFPIHTRFKYFGIGCTSEEDLILSWL